MNKRTINALYTASYNASQNARELRAYAEDIYTGSITGDRVLRHPENLRAVNRVIDGAKDSEYTARVTLQRARAWSH